MHRAEDPSTLRQYLEILHISLVQVSISEQLTPSRLSGHPEIPSEYPPDQYVWENIEQGPDSILMIRSTAPTRVRNIKIGRGAQVFLGTHP